MGYQYDDKRKEAIAVSYVTDDGQFGSTYCGKCGERLFSNGDKKIDNYGPGHTCPKCGYKIVSHELNRTSGGSDY